MSIALRDSAKTGVGRNTSQNHARLDRFADAEELSRELDTSRRQPKTLMRQDEELFGIRSLLTDLSG